MRAVFPGWSSCLLIFAAGCGSTGFRFSATPAPPLTATSLLVVGNSITEYGSAPSVGWTGDWGLAASAEDRDFAHLSAASFTMPFAIILGSPAEEDPQDNGQAVLAQVSAAITPRTLVVIELGENVKAANLAAFQPFFDALAQEASQGRAFMCLSDFWQYPPVDQLMQQSCTSHGGTWVFIGDLYTDPNNPDYQGPPEYANWGVEMHPHDWSMAQIADRVYSAGKVYVVGQ